MYACLFLYRLRTRDDDIHEIEIIIPIISARHCACIARARSDDHLTNTIISPRLHLFKITYPAIDNSIVMIIRNSYYRSVPKIDS